jgi:hypothetical protein
MTGAAREVGRHRTGDVPMAQRQGIGGGMGMVAALGPAVAAGRRCARWPPGAGTLVALGRWLGGWFSGEAVSRMLKLLIGGEWAAPATPRGGPVRAQRC